MIVQVQATYSRHCCILFLNPLSSWEITRLRNEFRSLKDSTHKDGVNRSFSFSTETQGTKRESEAGIRQRINQAVRSCRNMMMLMSMAHCDKRGT